MANTKKTPFFFREENCGLTVKGNLMTLAAKPEYVEKGEWIAHQGNGACLKSFYIVRKTDLKTLVVEQYRMLEQMMKIIQERDSRTNLPTCNPSTCPTMSAGRYDNLTLHNPASLAKA